MSEIIDNFMDQIPTSKSGSGTRLGKYEQLLSSDLRAQLDTFVEKLEIDGKSRGTAQSYKSHVAKAWALGQTWTEMTSDQHSAARAYKSLMG